MYSLDEALAVEDALREEDDRPDDRVVVGLERHFNVRLRIVFINSAAAHCTCKYKSRNVRGPG